MRRTRARRRTMFNANRAQRAQETLYDENGKRTGRDLDGIWTKGRWFTRAQPAAAELSARKRSA